MTWECWQLVYQAKAPVHIGYRTVGNIKLSRYYIPGKNFWGAATARLASLIKPLDYHGVGEFIRNNFIFSYFYPSTEPGKSYLPVFDREKGWRYGDLRQEEFEYNCINSLAGTSILSSTSTAADGTLHEIEYINSYWKTNEGQPVLFVGYLFVKKGAAYKGCKVGWNFGDLILCDILSDLSIGGERRYGFGRLQLIDRHCKPVSGDLYGGRGIWELDLDNRIIKVKALTDDAQLLAHCNVNKVDKASGALEPVVGREWVDDESSALKGRGAGQALKRLGICWTPGSLVRKNTVLKIGAYGIWSFD
ncbi:MAG: hypothetical protein A4E52_01717 [Pelotomaculum sp. PtaB.Bin013]|nr:MAG: hypothetical protein A4E52_01717 [Pelotomaculum sp. PtaB.Bin013]